MSKRKLRVLSIDGGGVRGVIPASILTYIERKFQMVSENENMRIADCFDIIVGTSTGGILACLYLTPNINYSHDGLGPISKYSAKEALDFYVENSNYIFNQSKRDSWFGFGLFVNARKFNARNIEALLLAKFGDLKMNDLLDTCVVTSYDMKSKTAIFFNSNEASYKQRSFYVRDVARSTSAAPTYFSPASIENLITGEKMYNIDGGMFANNPSMCAYAECRSGDSEQDGFPATEDILMLSLGTGGGQFDLDNYADSKNWGIVNWATSIPDIMMDGSVDTVDYQMKNIFGKVSTNGVRNYIRVDVPENLRLFSNDISDASLKNIADLTIAGQETLKYARERLQLDSFIDLLWENSPALSKDSPVG